MYLLRTILIANFHSSFILHSALILCGLWCTEQVVNAGAASDGREEALDMNEFIECVPVRLRFLSLNHPRLLYHKGDSECSSAVCL